MKSNHDSPSLKEKLLSLLAEEPNLTTEQLQSLTGTKLNTVQKALNQLKKKNLVVSNQLGMWTSYFWRLKSSKGLNEWTYRHEKACADVYVALKNLGEDFIWISKDDGAKGFRFDRAFKIFDRQFFLELETGSQFDHRAEKIPEKVKNYLKLDGKFHVIFAVMDYDERVTAERYIREILSILAGYRRGTQFLAVPHLALVKDLLGPWLMAPTDQIYSLQSLPSFVHATSIREDEDVLAI